MATASTGLNVGTATLAIGISEDDFGEIVELNQRRIYRLLLSMTRNPDTAETLTQECFLRAFEKRKSFRAEANVSTWLYRIAVNLARDHARNRRQGFWKKIFQSSPAETEEGEQTPEVEQLSDTRPSAETVVLGREAAGKVWEVLETLPEQQRAVFILRFVEELSIEEVAAATNLGASTVKTHLRRGLQKIRKQLELEGVK